MHLLVLGFALLVLSAALPAHSQDVVDESERPLFNTTQITPSFLLADAQTASSRLVQTAAADTSQENISIVVLSGNRELQREVFSAANEINRQGIPIVLILGPSLDPTGSSAAIQVYAKGVPASDGYGAIIGINNIRMVRPEVLRLACAAHNALFSGRCEG